VILSFTWIFWFLSSRDHFHQLTNYISHI
jgi:hypothetical protein